MDENTLLTAEERRDFREWERGFESEFWRKLTAELQEELDSAPAFLFWNVKSYEELIAARARLQAVAQLIAYPSTIEQKKDNMLHSRQFEMEEQSEDDSVKYL